MILTIVAAMALQGRDTDGEVWRIMAGGVSARCMIEVATATNEQHLLTQESYRQATERKAVELAGAAVRLARATDSLMYAYDSLMRRQRDLLDNHLITQAEYDADAARTPDLEPILHSMRAFPTCDFFRTAHGPSVRRARALLGR